MTAIVLSGVRRAPDHGPSVVQAVFQENTLKTLWLKELGQMRERVAPVRQWIAVTKCSEFGADQLPLFAKQFGMFSLSR